MAKKAIEVRECDRCGAAPANTWFITGPDGAPREIELCEQHGAPVANAYALGRPVARTAGKPATRAKSGAPVRAAEATPPAPPPSPGLLRLPPAQVPEPIWR
jgi:hypothetical protein